MQNRPVIGIIGCLKPLDGETAFTVKARYVEGVARFADAIPLVIPGLGRPEDAPGIVSRLDAILLTGSTSNVEPMRYRGAGEGREPKDSGRDATSIALVKAAKFYGVPVIGICRGLQEINVALGGTLIDERDAPGDFSHHAPDDADLPGMFGHAHTVEVSPGSALSRITGPGEIEVNSVHYQRVGQLGEGLRVEAVASDGVIEAISSREAVPQIFAVQWHPEWRPEERQHHLAFWRQVGEMARTHAASAHAGRRSADFDGI